MPRFFVKGKPSGEYWIGGEDGRHITRSLRMKPGERLTLCDGGVTIISVLFCTAARRGRLSRWKKAGRRPASRRPG